MPDSEARSPAEPGVPAPDHRLPARTRLGVVRLQVADLERSVGWYTRVLGLEKREMGPDTVQLSPEDGTDPLLELVERPGARPAPRGGRPGLFHFALLLPDRERLGAFVRHLWDLDEPAGASDHLVSEALYLRDPDGLGVEVYADRPRNVWRHQGRELEMATYPLDLRRLVREVDAAHWSGMPTGTTMGHIHLHVGDLERAQAFYHGVLGLDLMVWSYPGARFLSAGGYHHHLGLNTWGTEMEPAGRDEAKLLDWELVVPAAEDVEGVAGALESAGYPFHRTNGDGITEDPWGTRLRIRAELSG